MKDSSIEKIVKKAVLKIHKKEELPITTLPQRVRFCFFDSRSMFIPDIIPVPGDGPNRARVELSNFIKETDRRIRAGKKLFSGVVVYDPRKVSHNTATWMCPLLERTLKDFKRRDKKFHCIIATHKDKYMEYKKHTK